MEAERLRNIAVSAIVPGGIRVLEPGSGTFVVNAPSNRPYSLFRMNPRTDCGRFRNESQ
jgi:hypothetical protein